MSVLLIMTLGQTDVQLVQDGKRHTFEKMCLYEIHNQLKQREQDWEVVEHPPEKIRDQKAQIKELPTGSFHLCTPKVDAALEYIKQKSKEICFVLLFFTKRDQDKEKAEPHYVAEIIKRKFKDICEVDAFPYLCDNERLEDEQIEEDAVIRREVVKRLERKLRDCLLTQTFEEVVLSLEGGIPKANRLIEEITRFHTTKPIDLLHIPDVLREGAPQRDKAYSRKSLPEPEEHYKAWRYALELIERGNFLGAWGAVQHLTKSSCLDHRTKVIKWLADFASSLPLEECEIEVLCHSRRAVRSALRVEMALRSGDIPRAAHGTVAFFESAFWDHIDEYDFASEGVTRKSGKEVEFSSCPTDEQKKRFEKRKHDDKYQINDFSKGIKAWCKKLNKEDLTNFQKSLNREIKDLRDDFAHNEPTIKKMNTAKEKMQGRHLWSNTDEFISQPLVQNVLRELGVESPENLWTDLMQEVRERLTRGEYKESLSSE
jgi:hypothetical protein